MNDDALVDDALLLVEQNFYFLHMGEFLGKLSKTEDLSHDHSTFVVKKMSNGAYYLNAEITQVLLQNAYETKTDEISLFEYFVEFNAFRGICMAMVEALRLESNFREFMQEKLVDRFEDFVDILSFVRNVLSHNIHSEIKLASKDFDGTLKRIRRMQRKTSINFEFIYAIDLPEIASPNLEYGFVCAIDFEALDTNTEFLQVISHWQLFVLSELCFNLVSVFRTLQAK
ncbi:MAG: hypothetical protein IBX44_08280 [Sulfurospirillum sp.]|nr:hypothetical protein [Sulfurospirillum sp.]